MIAIKLAYKNLIGAGLRTWLNVAVLSFAFVLLIFYNGMIDGWNRQGRNDTQDWQIGQGQYWEPSYDQFDSYTIPDAHQELSNFVNKKITTGQLTPILIVQANIYPDGRMQNVLFKGIDPKQTILKLPSNKLEQTQGIPKAIIGERMAKDAKLQIGDNVLVRWRDKNGMFDASEIQIASIFKTDVPSVELGQIYLNIDDLQQMTGLENQATILVAGNKHNLAAIEGWKYKDLDFLLSDFNAMVNSERIGGMVISILLLLIALLAIFDTQVLSIFRRQKEIGTYIAMGMTQKQVVGIFTIEGAAHSILAILVGSVYGIPLFIWLSNVGIPLGASTQDMGITMAKVIYPYYSLKLITGSLILVIISATIVSYLPSRKIAKLKPNEALRKRT